MQTAHKWYLAAGIVAAAVLALPVTNMLAGGPRGTALTAQTSDDKQVVAVATLLEAKCSYCHVVGAPRPFYAKLPLASSLIEKDVTAGLRDFDLVEGMFPGDKAPPTEPTLAKLERVVRDASMPPWQFELIHWRAELGADDQATLLALVREARTKRFAPPGTPPDVAAGVLHPLPAQVEVDAKKAALGRKLYHDKRLSGDDTLSCATCHDLAKGGTDQEKVSTGIRGQKGGINAPTTLNAGFQSKQFWDGRAATLEEQADGPPNNPVEMGSNWDQISGKLAADEAFAAEFVAVYPDGFNKKNLTDAIAAFERTLVTTGSRFDKYLGGDAAALSADEKRGHELFLAKGCATCHVGKLLGGQSFERMGRRADYFKERGTPLTDADQGRFSVTKREQDRHKFKVPTLRNVARTFPYFHDGSAADLASAVQVMGRAELGVALTEPERSALVKFLEALTGELDGKAL